MFDIIKSYKQEVENQVKGISNYSIGMSGDYYLYCIEKKKGSKDVLISGGMHGDEPAGVYACLEFILSGMYEEYLTDFSFYIFPCINPWGFERHRRENKEGVDINRSFKEFEAIESKLIRDHIRDKKFIFTVDMHEGSPNENWREYNLSDNPDGIWLYEMCYNKKQRIGRKVIDRVKDEGYKVTNLDNVYDDICNDGLISYPECCVNAEYAALDSFDGYLWQNNTGQAFTTETICINKLEDRVNAQLLMLKVMLDNV